MSNLRNAPCQCGSGRKFKHCCFGKKPEVAAIEPVRKNWTWVFGLLAVVVIGPAIALFVSGQRSSVSEAPGEPVWNFEGRADPEPYHYDAVNNRHWDPGHGHWHEGPPPMMRGQAPAATIPMAETTPAPYHYDEANNRHWDPGHNHWHEGPPPQR